jgi:hypothetical protein
MGGQIGLLTFQSRIAAVSGQFLSFRFYSAAAWLFRWMLICFGWVRHRRHQLLLVFQEQKTLILQKRYSGE